jgi:hypothetical protein
VSDEIEADRLLADWLKRHAINPLSAGDSPDSASIEAIGRIMATDGLGIVDSKRASEAADLLRNSPLLDGKRFQIGERPTPAPMPALAFKVRLKDPLADQRQYPGLWPEYGSNETLHEEVQRKRREVSTSGLAIPPRTRAVHGLRFEDIAPLKPQFESLGFWNKWLDVLCGTQPVATQVRDSREPSDETPVSLARLKEIVGSEFHKPGSGTVKLDSLAKEHDWLKACKAGKNKWFPSKVIAALEKQGLKRRSSAAQSLGLVVHKLGR